MLAWSEELITDVENQKSWLATVIVGGELFWCSITLANLSRWIKLKSTGAGRYQLLSRWWDAYRKQPAWKTSRKSQDAVALWIKGVALHLMIDRVDIRQAIDRCSNIWASPPRRWLWSGCLKRQADNLITQNKKKRAERSERLMYRQSLRDYLRSGYLHHRLPVMGC